MDSRNKAIQMCQPLSNVTPSRKKKNSMNTTHLKYHHRIKDYKPCKHMQWGNWQFQTALFCFQECFSNKVWKMFALADEHEYTLLSKSPCLKDWYLNNLNLNNQKHKFIHNLHRSSEVDIIIFPALNNGSKFGLRHTCFCPRTQLTYKQLYS